VGRHPSYQEHGLERAPSLNESSGGQTRCGGGDRRPGQRPPFSAPAGEDRQHLAVPDDFPFSLADFDRYVEEHGIPEEGYPAAFAQWIAEKTGGPAPRFEKVVREAPADGVVIEGDDL
jgi:hypothetical protein